MRMSDSIANLAAAMALFQAETKNPANTADNPFFKSKYAPLNEILAENRPLLTKQGLSIVQSPAGDGQNITITTILLHKSGEWIEFDPLTLRSKDATPQGAGSAITYGRRYTLAAVLGISSEDDDDGNNASGKGKKEDAAPKQDKKQDKPTEQPPEMTEAQKKAIRTLYAAAKDKGMDEVAVKAMYKAQTGKDSLRDITMTEYGILLRDIKAKEGANAQ